jgi:RimJ/RimL family protein N-acetyltransferase
MPMDVISTSRLALRQLGPPDAPFILTLLNEPSFVQFIGERNVRSIADAERYILTGPVASYERFGFGLWRVALKGGDVPIGMCGLLKRDALDDVDLGFALLPAFWRQGYATEAAQAVLAYGKQAFGLERVVAITSPGNERSERVLAKLGFVFERMTRLTPSDKEVRLLAHQT